MVIRRLDQIDIRILLRDAIPSHSSDAKMCAAVLFYKGDRILTRSTATKYTTKHMTDLETHPIPDSVDPDDWSLRITGAIERTHEYTRADMRALPLETFTQDFECVEGWVATGLDWRGVRVGDLLERAAPTTEGYGLVRSMDEGYACSFKLDRLRDAVIAVEVDGESLPVEHGGPARFVPTDEGRDCWESVKWVTEIQISETEPVDADTAGEIALGSDDI
ncbi:molybdopterin-dependent oxidoreductase [Halovenus sp. HT40]|uniref:molybdopterin-dependent oxidoreductase n=1 Tax=Halovenus sp. HT40 TaxID=3126691 RepID=UPI00300ECE1C